jgi:hypothetical protein
MWAVLTTLSALVEKMIGSVGWQLTEVMGLECAFSVLSSLPVSLLNAITWPSLPPVTIVPPPPFGSTARQVMPGLLVMCSGLAAVSP